MPLLAYLIEVFHSGKLASGSLMALYWWRCSKMFFISLPKCSTKFSYVLIIVIHIIVFVPVDDVIFCCMGSLALGDESMFLIVLFKFKVVVDAILTASFLYVFKSSLYIWNDYVSPWFLLCVVVLLLMLFGLPWQKFLCSMSSVAHAGCLPLVRTSLMCSTSVLRCSVVEDTVLALWFSVLMTLFFAPM